MPRLVVELGQRTARNWQGEGGRSRHVRIFRDGVELSWQGQWGTGKAPRPPHVESPTDVPAGYRASLRFLRRCRTQNKLIWMYEVVSVPPILDFAGRTAHLSAPAPLETLAPGEDGEGYASTSRRRESGPQWRTGARCPRDGGG